MRLFEIAQPVPVVWKPIEGWSKYEVSDTGLVRNVIADKLVAQWDHTRRGVTYKRVTLRQGGERWNPRVHRLVALAFIPNPEDLPEVDHINDVSFDNSVSNLEWVTGEENIDRMHIRRRSRKDDPVPGYA